MGLGCSYTDITFSRHIYFIYFKCKLVRWRENLGWRWVGCNQAVAGEAVGCFIKDSGWFVWM